MPYPWSAGNVLTATDLNSSLAAKYDSAPAINAQTGTTYTFVLTDATAGKTITASNAAASTYTVPPQSSVAFSAGALLRVTNLGAGVVTFAGGSGVTVTNTAGTLAQYQTATLVRTGSDAWTVIPAGGASGLTLIATATASASSTVSINNCFISAYDNYLVMMTFVMSGSNVLNMRLRVSGTDAITNYRWQTINANGASVGAAASSAQTSFSVGDAGTDKSTAQIYVFDPFKAEATNIHHRAMARTVPTYYTNLGQHTTATAYDGITFLASAGTFTTPTNGIRVYGYKNS